MLRYTGHPLVDVGIATIAAFAGKPDPTTLTEADLDAIADYMEANYVVDPLKSFLTVAFPNSGFTQPAFNTQPEQRRVYAQKVLRAYRAETPTADALCVFTGEPVPDIALNVSGDLVRGRTFRQHVPLLTGEGVINFYPYGDPGLPVSGKVLLAIQAFPLGCAKVGGRLLAVHSDDSNVTYQFARRFLEHNRKAIHSAQQAGEKKLPEYPRRPGTLIVEILLDLEKERVTTAGGTGAASITAYHLTNSGQGVALDIYHLPMEIGYFLRTAMSAQYRGAWEALCARGWEISRPRRRGQEQPEPFSPRYNVLYEDLFRLPEDAARFIRRYFLRAPQKVTDAGDPRSTYSIKGEAGLVSWDLTALFLREVVNMNRERIERIRKLGDDLAEYVDSENDRRFFHAFLTAQRYDTLRAVLLRASIARLKRSQSPLVAFDDYISIFEEGEDLPYSDWRLARDLVLIRMVEQLYRKEWIQKHAAELPETGAEEDQEITP